MTYEVRYRPRAAGQLGDLPKNVQITVAKVIDALAENPRPRGAIRLKGTNFLRVRIRDYRVVYQIEDEVLVVLVVRLGHPRDVYRGL